jgi:hypothetical protein
METVQGARGIGVVRKLARRAPDRTGDAVPLLARDAAPSVPPTGRHTDTRAAKTDVRRNEP